MSNSGIYYIRCKVNNKLYIGCSSKLNRRIAQHKCLLLKGKHDNNYLQNAFNKHGIDNFEFVVLQRCSDIDMYMFEDFWCRLLSTHDDIYGYNILLTGTDNNRQHSIVTKNKLSEKFKGRKLTEEWKNKIRLSRLGKKKDKSEYLHRCIPIRSMDLDGNVLCTYHSIREASRCTGISASCILGQLKGGISNLRRKVYFKYAEY